ncbi:hypothetical protein J1N35_038273 [Gossypium stocksii]|uniref:Uncharacterized protein n=1 Tax=Gossypium stocksii TaxID=47602 RepID=A0A9D3UNI5_9ROSI|nr:hypothetical protein J1N35_038273 [Gossypium stocksii]
MTEEVFDPIDLAVNVAVNVKVDIIVDEEVELTTDIKFKPSLNESVNKPVHFLAKTEEVPTKQPDEFISFSFDVEVFSSIVLVAEHYGFEGLSSRFLG